MSVINIDLPDSISQKLNELSENKVEIEQFIVVAVAEKLNYLQDKAKRANFDEFDKILAKVPNVEAEEFDKIR
ncbi:MAG: toxin-antitoxin system HicB family antitoxin [Acidobacteriota bacterium]|nr:toxin-antitoxin system HicB family antitoxin [Acidobacteriota bacterium]